MSQAADVIDEENSIEKREAAIEANRLSPDLVPAAAMAAREYIAQGKPKLAVRSLKGGKVSHILIWQRPFQKLHQMKRRKSA